MAWDLPVHDVDMPESDVQAVVQAYRDGWLTMGPRSQEFERRFAELSGARVAVAVSSGTAALQLSLIAAGIGPGDEVLVPALTFVAAPATIRAVGATPVFVDSLGAHDPNLDTDDALAKITPRTRAIMPVHLAGYACDLAAVAGLASAHDLLVIEDCAQAIGARAADGAQVGTVGTMGCFSFSARKQFTTGEGGMVVSDDEALAAKVKSLRSHAMTSVTWDRHRGHAESYDILDIGFNYRLDEPRAALALARLERLEADLDARRAMVAAYRAALADDPAILVPWTDEDVARGTHYAFLVLLDDARARDGAAASLAGVGIETSRISAVPALTAYAAAGPTATPRAQEIADRHLLLPLASTYGEAEVDRVVAALRESR